MEETDQDRISNLPVEIIEDILALLPTKSVVTTSALSTRWLTVSTSHLTQTTNLDFGKEFGERQSPEEFTLTVNRLLSLNTARKIDKFHLHFDPDYHYRSIAKGWIKFAAERSVKELNLDFCRLTDIKSISVGTFELPKFLFDCASLIDCASLTHLKLSRCSLGLPLEYTGLGLLRSLSLDYVHITASELKILLSNSPLIETLVIDECGPLKPNEIIFSSLHLKHFTLYCWLQPIDQIVINAPNLSMFAFRGKASKNFSLNEISSLQEAVIEVSERLGEECENFYNQLLSNISDVKALTVYADYLPHHMPSGVVKFSNLQELRFQNGSGPGVTRIDVYNFFRHCSCPLLKRLSIELSPYPDDSFYSGDQKLIKEEGWREYTFHHLRSIEISNFQQMDCQIELFRFFLQRCSTVLESMFLVAPRDYDSGDEDGDVVSEKPFYLSNAPSTVRIIFRQYLKPEDPKED